MNPRDIMQDGIERIFGMGNIIFKFSAIHNFHPQYQQYTQVIFHFLV